MKMTMLSKLRPWFIGTGPETQITVRDLLEYKGVFVLMALLMLAAALA